MTLVALPYICVPIMHCGRAGDSSSAAAWGSFHFARSPQAGEEVEIDGTVVVVTRAWHRPSIYYKGAKFAILVEEPVADAQVRPEVRDHADMAV